MENIKILEAFNFANVKGNKLTVQRGVNTEENTLRYRVYGDHVPFPVWCGTWFCGIPWAQFLKSLNELGYSLYAKANMHTGMTDVYPVDFDIPSNAMAEQTHALFTGIDELYRKGNDHEARVLHDMARELTHGNLSSYDEYVLGVADIDHELEISDEQYHALITEIIRLYRLGEENDAYCLYEILRNGDENCPDFDEITLGKEKGSLVIKEVVDVDQPFLREAVEKILAAPGMNKMTAVKLTREVSHQKLSVCAKYVDGIRSEMER